MKNSNHIKKLVLTALFAAITCIFTMIHLFPSPLGGYIHIGDCFVLLSGFYLGPVYGAFAAGIGSSLADLFAGYPTYAVATFIIKFVMALVAALIVKGMSKMRFPIIGKIVGGIVAEVIMVGGYYLFSAVFLGAGFEAGLATIPGDFFQGGMGIVFAIVISEILRKSKADKIFY